MASSAAVVIALTWGGITYAWSSPRVLVPLVLGLAGIAFWLLYEAVWATHPIVRVVQSNERVCVRHG